MGTASPSQRELDGVGHGWVAYMGNGDMYRAAYRYNINAYQHEAWSYVRFCSVLAPPFLVPVVAISDLGG